MRQTLRRVYPLMLLLFFMVFNGCATIVSGSGQSLMVITEKDVVDASCELTDKKGGRWYVPRTPGSVTVRKGDAPMLIVCRKDGYRPGRLSVEEDLTGAFWANIILGGGIGMLVDAASGAAQEYPSEVIVWMEPLKMTDEERRIWLEEKKAFDDAIKAKEAAERAEETAVDSEEM